MAWLAAISSSPTSSPSSNGIWPRASTATAAGRAHRFTTAFLHHPDELRAEIDEAGLQLSELVGLEGLAGWLPQLADRWDDRSDRERILWAARMVEGEPSLSGLSAHLLAVAHKP